MSFGKRHEDGLIENVPAAVDANGKVINAGFDQTENVQMVAVMVWNTSTLAWERGTLSGGGGGGGSSPTTSTKRFDKADATTMYVGQANVGTADSSPGWGIKKYTFDAAGNATSLTYATGAWTNRASLSYS